MLDEPEIIKIDNVEYKVEGFTEQIQQSFKRMMESKFLDIVKDNKPELGMDYLPLLHKHYYDVKQGAYRFGGDNFYLFVQDTWNFTELLWWCFCKYQPCAREVIEKWVGEEIQTAINLFERLMASSKKN